MNFELIISTIIYNIKYFFIEDVYENKRIDGSGMCLITKLIGRAYQMIYNDELLGIVKGYDKNKPNILLVDFGLSEHEIRVDIDELIISGQKYN